MPALKKSNPQKPRPGIHEMSLAQINDDPELQPRRQMDLDVLREYSALWAEGAQFPPVVLFFDGSEYWLADGFYRVRSARKANLDTIRAVIHDGTKRDAKLYAAGANATHGLRRSSEDKKKAILLLLDDPEWCLWSDAEIAKACRVGAATVNRYREGSPGLRGHGVTARIGSNGVIKTSPDAPALPEGLAAATFKRPPVMMTQAEVREKFLRRIQKHLAKADPTLTRDVPVPVGGTVDMVGRSGIYAFLVVQSAWTLYATAGRMIVARSLLAPSARITIVGHFPQAVAPVIKALGALDVHCETPEQVLSR